MKVARIAVWSVELVCPGCGQTVTDSKGKQSIIRRDEEGMVMGFWGTKKPFECKECHAQFVLPKSPFGKEGE